MVSPKDVKRLTESTDRHILTLYFNTRSDQQRSAYPARLRCIAPMRTSQMPMAAEQIDARAIRERATIAAMPCNNKNVLSCCECRTDAITRSENPSGTSTFARRCFQNS